MVFSLDNQVATASQDSDAPAQGESAAAARMRLLQQMETLAQREWKQLQPAAVVAPPTDPATLDLAWDMGLDGQALAEALR